MARIVGVDLPKNKRGEIGLTYIYGIGRSTARKILDEAGISYDLKVQDWSDEQVGAIRSKIADMGIKVEGTLFATSAHALFGFPQKLFSAMAQSPCGTGDALLQLCLAQVL